MSEWVWVNKAAVFAIHDAQLAEHGGLPGIKDIALVESALARPENIIAYRQSPPEVAALAAAYAYGIARNHAFVDGNKRVSSVVSRLFLRLNRFDLLPGLQTVRYRMWIALADGDLSEQELVAWYCANITPLK